MIARTHDAIARPQESVMGRTSGPRIYYFQAWHSAEKPVSEAYCHNQAMARYINKHLKQLDAELAKVLHIGAATPTNRTISHVTPRTVYVSFRNNVDSEADEENSITAFRDAYYGDLAIEFFKEIKKTLDFYNCFLDGPKVTISGHFSTVSVRKGFYKMRHKLQLQKRESLGDIVKGLADGAVSFPIDVAATAVSCIQSRCGSQNFGQEYQPADLSNAPNHNAIQTAKNALLGILDVSQWLAAQCESTPVTASIGTAESFCQFERKSKQFIILLKDLIQACKNAEEKGDALNLSKIWRSIVSADTVQRHGGDFIVNLNGTGLLNTVLGRHSATRSTAYAAGCVGGVVVAAYGVATLSGWPMITVLAVGCITALLTGHQSLKHKRCRDRIRDMEVDLASFREAWDAVTRTLAIQLLTLSGVKVTIENRELRDNILEDIGMDVHDFNEEDYTIASLAMRVEHLEQTFSRFIENVDWINEQEDLGLRRA